MIVAPSRFAVAGGGTVPHTSTITIASGKVSSNLTDFPLYVDLSDMPSGFWDNVANDGSDIEVTDSGGTPIAFDLVYFDHSGQAGDLYFKAPSVLSGSSNTFDINVGDGATAPGTGDPLGRDATWALFTPNGRVYHGRENVDRTGTGGAATLNGNASFTDGFMTFDGAGDYISSALSAEPTILSMVALQVTMDALGVGHRGCMTVGQGTSDTNRISMYRRGSGSPAGRMAIWNTTNGFGQGTAPVIVAGTPFSSSCDHSNGVVRNLYIDGASVFTAAAAADVLTAAPTLYIGVEDASASEPMQGTIRFCALKTGTILSAAEHKALHDNVVAPSSFYTAA